MLPCADETPCENSFTRCPRNLRQIRPQLIVLLYTDQAPCFPVYSHLRKPAVGPGNMHFLRRPQALTIKTSQKPLCSLLRLLMSCEQCSLWVCSIPMAASPEDQVQAQGPM